MNVPPKTPANYFGKGADYVLPDNLEIIHQFERDFDAWVRENSDDPTGEKALALWEQSQLQPPELPPLQKKKELLPSVELPAKVEVEVEHLTPTKILDLALKPIVVDVEQGLETVQLTLELPEIYVERFKKFCKFKRKRPRDVLLFWILQHAKIENI